jgi:hypothetical protein
MSYNDQLIEIKIHRLRHDLDSYLPSNKELHKYVVLSLPIGVLHDMKLLNDLQTLGISYKIFSDEPFPSIKYGMDMSCVYAK